MFLTRILQSKIPKTVPLLLVGSIPFTTSVFSNLPYTTPDATKATLANMHITPGITSMGSMKNQAGPPASAPGKDFEVRQTSTTEDYTPNPSKSIPIPPNRQALLDDIIALYSCKPTVERVRRYTPDCVYDDQFVYANDRYKMAGQWFALPKLFKDSKNENYEVVRSDDHVLQFKNEQSWTFLGIPKTATINALVTLSLDPATVGSDFERVKYHKDQANDKDYSHTGLGFNFKKWQADKVPGFMKQKEIEMFNNDAGAGGEDHNTYKSGKEDGNAPKSTF